MPAEDGSVRRARGFSIDCDFVTPPIRDEQQGRLRTRPEQQSMLLPMRLRFDRFRHVNAGIQPDRCYHSRRIGLKDTNAEGLRNMAGEFDLEQVGNTGLADCQRIRFPGKIFWRRRRTELDRGGLKHAVRFA